MSNCGEPKGSAAEGAVDVWGSKFRADQGGEIALKNLAEQRKENGNSANPRCLQKIRKITVDFPLRID
ncbi:MAG: hypothetical protein LUF86_01770 [Clostridiales bacterium]|nr:hypothetical protein [Clostridiales bacterium]